MAALKARTLPSPSRVEAYSDAIFSIVATITIIPIAHTAVGENENLQETLKDLALKLVIYVISFFVITGVRDSHIWLFDTLRKVDELIVLMNLVLMMAITFMPFAFTLLSFFPMEKTAIILYCMTEIVVDGLHVLFIYYAFKTEKVLKEEVKDSYDKNQRKNLMIRIAGTPALLCLAAAITSPFSPLGANICLLFLMVPDLIRIILEKLYEFLQVCLRVVSCKKKEPEQTYATLEEYVPFSQRLLQESTRKQRVECFSDGVFAIVATIIILDICERYIPSQSDVDRAGSLEKAMDSDWPTFLAYAGTFVTVGLLWYVHHSILHYALKMNALMVLFNNMCLVCISLCPLGFKLLGIYSKQNNSFNGMVAIQFNSAIWCISGILQLAMWVSALYSPKGTLLREAHYGRPEHAHMTAKLLVFPLLSLFIYFTSFADTTFTTTVYSLMQLSTVLVFAALRLIFYKLQSVWRYEEEGDQCPLLDPVEPDIQEDGLDLNWQDVNYY